MTTDVDSAIAAPLFAEPGSSRGVRAQLGLHPEVTTSSACNFEATNYPQGQPHIAEDGPIGAVPAASSTAFARARSERLEDAPWGRRAV
jgi:hypothetical protein